MDWRRIVVRVALAMTCGLAACTADNPSRSVENTATTSSAGTQSLTITLRLPNTTNITAATVASTEGIEVGKHSRVDGPVTTSGELEVGHHAEVGAITAIGNASLAQHSRVRGDVHVSGELRRHHHALVDGEIRTNAPLAPGDVTWTIEASDQSSGHVELEPGQLRDLAPGTYGDLVVPSRARVVLHSGIYLFERLVVRDGAEILVDDRGGPAQVYVKNEVRFRGDVRTATVGTPQLLIGYLGTETVSIEAPFTGVFVAPDSEVVIEPCKPGHHHDDHEDDHPQDRKHAAGHGHEDNHRCNGDIGHLGAFYGKRVRVEDKSHVAHMGLDWGAIAGPTILPSVEGKIPRYMMPASPVSLWVDIDANGVGGGAGAGSSMDTDDPVDFELQQEYQVASGIIANGTVLFRFQETTGPLVTCTYQGLSPTASPLSPTDLNLGRMLRFVGCTDGRPVNALRRGTHFELFVNPAPGYPVSVTPPIIRDGGCSEELPILTPDETRRLREGFDWSQMAKVEETNPGGSPALYYAWIYIRNPTEALALRKLYIHVLKRPLFTEELARYAGRCGTLTNPGDGEGVFVPVLIPGVTYNKLIEALTSPDVTGDRTIFDVVRIRALAPEHRYPNGAIRTDLLFASGFQYLDYETKPLRTPDQIQLDGGATKVLTDVLAWVANAARNVSEFLTNTLGAIAGAFAGRVEMTLHLHAINRDPSFVSPADPDPIMMRGWGDWAAARHPLGALGMEATILQRVGFLPFPFTSQGRTDRTGRVSIRAVRDARPFETALCMNLQTEAALVTDFLISNEVCDFRAFEVGREPTSYNLGLNFVLSDFSRDREGDVHVNNTRLTGLYQADDVWLWGNDVLHFRPSRRARILSGYFATTLSPTTQTGRKRLYAPCLGHPNNLSGAIAAVGAAGGALVAAGFGPGAAVGAAAGFVFGSVIGNTDIVMSTESKLATDRVAMSHEYGHYQFCSLLESFNATAVDHLAWATISTGTEQDLSAPLQYTNEAMAEFFAGQVAGAASYGWATAANGFATPPNAANTCVPGGTVLQGRCFDANLSGFPTTGVRDTSGIGRMVTLLFDAYDGHNQRFGRVPGDGDVWTAPPAVLSPTGYANLDANLERVALHADTLKGFAQELAQGLGPFVFESGVLAGATIRDTMTYPALNHAMESQGYSWCDRCRVFALHSPLVPTAGVTPTIAQLFGACVADGLIASSLGGPPPEPALRIDANTCTPCPPSFTSDANGVCVPCVLPRVVVGNQCVECPADVVRDGNTLTDETLNAGFSIAGDACPGIFWLEIQNPLGVFTRGLPELTVLLDPVPGATQPQCEREFSLFVERYSSRVPYVREPTVTEFGRWAGGAFGSTCTPSRHEQGVSFPMRSFSVAELANEGTFAVRAGTPTDASSIMSIQVTPEGGPR